MKFILNNNRHTFHLKINTNQLVHSYTLIRTYLHNAAFLITGILFLKYSNALAPDAWQSLNAELETFLSEYQNMINKSSQMLPRESAELAISLRLEIAAMELKNKNISSGNC